MKLKKKLFFIVLFIFRLNSLVLGIDEAELSKLRKAMVETQIKAEGIKDERVLQAMLKVKRHLFVPEEYKNTAYINGPLPIGEGQTISQPYIVALMTELLELKGNEKVLEIGTGSGYQAAILGELAKEVYTIEILDILGRRAEKLLNELKYKNIKVKIGDGYLGWLEYAPFDAIIVTAAPEEIPKALIEQLAEGGKMVIPVEDQFPIDRYSQKLKLVRKINGKPVVKDIIAVRFVPMIKGLEKK
ncbi:MAG: protein-L-isoaspartate(D-aspartate) O-methyltransferase [bacterium]|nr:protein-L-isoaspartate(D-aspartate) O-methyltransferase [bacterium]